MANKNVDLGWMRVFDESVRRGSFSAAARALGTSQPAVSYQIRQLEQQLGFAVLRRGNSGVELTNDGRALHLIVSQAVSGIDDLAARQADAGRQVVRLRTDSAFSAYWLVPRMQEFRRLHPQIDIQVFTSQRPALEKTDDTDVAVIFAPMAEHQHGTSLIPENVAPVCSPGMAEELGLGTDLAALASARLIHVDTVAPAPWIDWQFYLNAQGLSRQTSTGDISFNAYSLVIQAALAGQGVAMGWLGLVDSFVQTGMLVHAGPTMSAKDRGYLLVPARRATAANTALTEWLRIEAAG